ncbi:virulence factor [Thiolinea disciformis]|uniref:virulence factor n=1 Tax=Thiolinea disciformis TaxID=125614 RepID=UPI000361F9F3|nr:virulence factor [Thiolinea disciformis]
MIEKVIIYWRDIPSQVLLRRGRTKAKALLSERFQDAIDRAAMRARKADAAAYIEEWRRERTEMECEGDLDECAKAQVALIEADFPHEKLEAFIRNHALKPDA